MHMYAFVQIDENLKITENFILYNYGPPCKAYIYISMQIYVHVYIYLYAYNMYT